MDEGVGIRAVFPGKDKRLGLLRPTVPLSSSLSSLERYPLPETGVCRQSPSSGSTLTSQTDETLLCRGSSCVRSDGMGEDDRVTFRGDQ